MSRPRKSRGIFNEATRNDMAGVKPSTILDWGPRTSAPFYRCPVMLHPGSGGVGAWQESGLGDQRVRAEPLPDSHALEVSICGRFPPPKEAPRSSVPPASFPCGSNSFDYGSAFITVRIICSRGRYCRGARRKEHMEFLVTVPLLIRKRQRKHAVDG